MVADVLKNQEPEIECVPLAETLNFINKSGLAEDHKAMYTDYRDTGQLKKSILKRWRVNWYSECRTAQTFQFQPERPWPIFSVWSAADRNQAGRHQTDSADMGYFRRHNRMEGRRGVVLRDRLILHR